MCYLIAKQIDQVGCVAWKTTYGAVSYTHLDVYKRQEFEIFELGGIEPNPRIESVYAGAEICKEEDIDVILAVGGGSTIDCSKAIAAAAYYEGDAWDLILHPDWIEKALPICTVLTLSATGSEMDNGGVITNLKTKEKLGFGNPLLLPKASVPVSYTHLDVYKRQASGYAKRAGN